MYQIFCSGVKWLSIKAKNKYLYLNLTFLVRQYFIIASGYRFRRKFASKEQIWFWSNRYSYKSDRLIWCLDSAELHICSHRCLIVLEISAPVSLNQSEVFNSYCVLIKYALAPTDYRYNFFGPCSNLQRKKLVEQFQSNWMSIEKRCLNFSTSSGFYKKGIQSLPGNGRTERHC